MGKGSKTRARAVKLQHKREMPSLAPVKRREQPRAKGRYIRQEDSPEAMRLQLIKRAARLGLPPVEQVLRAMKAVHLGCEAGLAIHIGSADQEERQALWSIIKDWRTLESRFLGHVVGKRVYSGKDSIPYIPEPLTTRDDQDHDDRTDEEKADAARKGWNAWCEHTAILTREQAAILWDAVWEVDGRPLVKDAVEDNPAMLTRDGAGFMFALRVLAKEIEK